MSDRDLAIARAALEAAATLLVNRQDARESESRANWSCLDAAAIRALDPATIVAGVPPRHKAERVMDELNHHALDENQRLAARVAELERSNSAYRTLQESIDKRMARQTLDEAALRTLDSEREANALLTARVAELEKDAARYRHMKSNATFQNRNGPGLYWYLPRCNRELPIGERLDAAIDAAMLEEK